jgi:uncharacterized protein (DUF952 family)
MRRIYHLVPRATWEKTPPGPYRAASLDREGFIHCSNREQVAWAANRFYASENDLLVLVIDAGRLTSPLRDEDAGWGELFPHIQGPINREAIEQVVPMSRGPDGCWAAPGG